MKKCFVLMILLASLLTLVGCDEWNGMWDNLDEETTLEIADVDTKEEAVTFLINKVKTWKYAEAEVTALSIFSLPIEAHFDFEDKVGYAVEYTDSTNQTINHSYYAEEAMVYAYDQANTDPYDSFDAAVKFQGDVDLNKYLNMLDEETVNLDDINLDKADFSKDEISFTLAFDFTLDGTTYDVEILYKRLGIRVIVGGLATVTFEQTETNYFDTFTFDKTPYLN